MTVGSYEVLQPSLTGALSQLMALSWTRDHSCSAQRCLTGETALLGLDPHPDKVTKANMVSSLAMGKSSKQTASTTPDSEAKLIREARDFDICRDVG